MVTITSLVRKSYTIKHKRMTVRDVAARVAAGSSVSFACSLASVERRQYYRWKRVVLGEKDTHPKQAKTSQDTSPATLMPTMSTKFLHGNLRSLNEGRMSILAPIEMDLLRFLFEYREHGIQVTTKMVRKFVEKVMPEFRPKTKIAKQQCVRRFLCHAGYSHRLSTHTAQRKPKETKKASSEFMEFMRRKVTQMHPDHVLNWARCPFPSRFIRSARGQRKVHVQFMCLRQRAKQRGQRLQPLSQ